MDIKRARETPIPGYCHPETTNVDRDNKYKTFTEGKKTKKFGTTSVGNQYAKYSDIDENKEDDLNCPKCKEPSLETCPCAYNDKKCGKGHIWYTSRDGKIRLGNPHKK